MLKRKRPKMLRKRRIMDVGAVRRRIKRNVAVLKLHRRKRNFLTILHTEQQSEAIS
jgi:hypothetical protein